jgi:hypothetical protein
VLAGACAGCAAAGAVGLVTQVAPEVAMGSAQLVGIQASAKDSAGGVSNADNPDKCEQLVRAQPGVEEIRKTKDGVIESRQWKIAETSGDPIWIVARTQSQDTPANAWQPKPGVTKLMFDPPLYEMLKPDQPEYLAYAPSDVVNVADSEQFDSMTETFGSGVGTFKWRDRAYSYVLVKELPCFKPEKEK